MVWNKGGLAAWVCMLLLAGCVHGGNYYFRWVMSLTMKRWPDAPIRAVGMSHVRFDAAGKVTFHQDYWDTGLIYERIPVLGAVIRWIKGRI